MANPVSGVSSTLQASQIPASGQAQDAKPAPKQHVIPQDSVAISQSGKEASRVLAASKSGQSAIESESSGEIK